MIINSSGRLTSEQLAQFDREGFIVFENLFNDNDLQEVINELNSEVNELARGMIKQKKLSRTYEEYDFIHQLTKISQESDALAVSIWNGHLSGPAVFNLIRNPKLLDIVESFLGPELIASSVYRVLPKMPSNLRGAITGHHAGNELRIDVTLQRTIAFSFFNLLYNYKKFICRGEKC